MQHPIAFNRVVSVCSPDEVFFTDGTSCRVDVIVCATGYHYSYPFLQIPDLTSPEKQCVNGLFEHVFRIDNPSLAFVGLPKKVANS
jgi:hypothetical protein